MRIIVLFALCRYAHSCAFISVIELPRIPAYCPKLEDISYFALIDGYKNLFYNPMTRKYREGTTFEDIVALYEFDEKLRALIFQYLCHFEQKMRSLISYHFCDTYSERQEDYLDTAHY
ncbi:Abortive infection bacteriophage resistance protein [uncultured Clostridium sp.]|nr:Abortive infection bacteriophage resistance protein [uncultured Clostridium sp.]